MRAPSDQTGIRSRRRLGALYHLHPDAVAGNLVWGDRTIATVVSEGCRWHAADWRREHTHY